MQGLGLGQGLVVCYQLWGHMAVVPHSAQTHVAVSPHFQYGDGAVVHISAQPGLRWQLESLHHEVSYHIAWRYGSVESSEEELSLLSADEFSNIQS